MSRLIGAARVGAVCAYVALVAAGLTTDLGPAAMWLGVVPCLPLVLAFLGFHFWRRICPLALIGSVGASGFRRRRAQAHHFLPRAGGLIALATLSVFLVARHAGLNSDGRVLSASLVALALSAMFVNFIYSGRTWCHALCPVGVVERIYASLQPTAVVRSSRCASCTACQSRCPDIRLHVDDRLRHAHYLFPGIVAGFYLYFFLRTGSFDSYFDGAWVELPLHRLPAFKRELVSLEVPVWLGSSLTLTLAATLSWLVFRSLERVLSARARERAMATAAFLALTIYTYFTSEAALRSWPALALVGHTALPAAFTLMLHRRLRRKTQRPRAHRKGQLHVLRTTTASGA
jgi:NAD-dependent dihydropyrimidine dehydrogenase PreA subunit